MIIIKELISALISVTCFDTSKHRSKLRFIARSSVSTSNNTVQPGGRQRPAWASQASEVQRLTPPRCGRRLLEVQQFNLRVQPSMVQAAAPRSPAAYTSMVRAAAPRSPAAHTRAPMA